MGWSGRAPAPPAIEAGKGRQEKEHAMSQTLNTTIAVVGIDIGKNSFHIVGHDERGAIVLRQKWSRGQVEGRFCQYAAVPDRDGRLALHRVWERLVSQRTDVINQIRAFLLERGIARRQGQRFLRAELATPPDVLSPRMLRIIEDLAGDWRRLDKRVEGLSNEIEAIARQDAGFGRLMSVPGIGPMISSAMVAAIGAGDVFTKGRDFAAWLGLVPKQISTGDRTILG